MKLKLSNLSKSFGNKNILNDFSCYFEETGLYALIGESGIGKTTLLRMISGLDNHYKGTIENGGIGNVSFMFQEYRLFPALTALQNASVASTDLLDEKARELLLQLGFNIDDLTKKPAELSGGMKQRVAFVRAIVKDSPILILDEPTKELDQNTASIMLEMIKNEAKKRLVLLVTHDDIKEIVDSSHIIQL